MIDWLLAGGLGPGGTLVWTAPPWVPVLVGVACLAALVLAARPRPASLARWVELGLYGLAGAVLTVASAGPSWVQEGERLEEGRFVALVDGSRSMGVLEADGTARSEQVAEILEQFPDAEVHTFGDALRSGAPDAYDLGDTDVGGALSALAQRYAGEKLAGVALVTDGLDRGGLRRRLMADGDTVLPKLGGPLTVYQVGGAEERPDVAVTDVRAGGFAFLRAPFGIEVDVRVRGMTKTTLPVTLTRDGQPAGTSTVQIGEDGTGTVRFEVTPDTVGRFIYEASVPVSDGDAVPANNGMDLAVRVVRDRVRVLQVSGSPSVDQKFLRLFLKEDPGVDLVSFFILRTQQDFGSGYNPSEISLIQFPYQRLFADDLWTFDLVILQNFDYEPYFEGEGEQMLANLAEYVKGGKALMMIGGDRSFDLGGYADTPLAEVLPVKLGVAGDAVDTAPFEPRLTDGGARHPVTALLSDPAENARAWQQLSPLDGVNLTAGAAEGAAVLLEHPTRTGPDGAPLPVLAVGEYGAGRTMALTHDSSWRWSFSEAAQGRGNQAYLRYWKNTMRWLIGDPEDRAVVVESTRENYQLGEEVKVSVRVRDLTFAAVAGARVRGEVSGPGGRTPIEGVTAADGTLAFTVPAQHRGAHRVKVSARAPDGKDMGEAQTVYAVVTRDPELEEIQPDSGFLRALAARAGGRYVAAGEREEPLRDPDAGRRVRDRRETPLYAMPLLPVVFGLGASVSWWLRRREGLR